MPNHVHLLLLPKTSLPVILRWLKGSAARQANLILGRTGEAFWQDESFDHCVRDEAELDRLVRYVEYNPVSAGLAANPRAWRWSSARLGRGRDGRYRPPPSPPGEFHPEPLTEPCVNLSIYTARAIH